MKSYYRLSDEAAFLAELEAGGIVLNKVPGLSRPLGGLLDSIEGIREQVSDFTGPNGMVFFINRSNPQATRLIKKSVTATLVKPQVVGKAFSLPTTPTIPTILPTENTHGKQQRT